MKKFVLFVCSFSLLQLAYNNPVSANSYYYTVNQMDSYGSSNLDYVCGISDDNLIAGTSDNHAVIWEYDPVSESWAAAQRIESTYGSSSATYINANGLIAYFDKDLGYSRAHSWSAAQGDTLLHSSYSEPMDINENGQIVGHRGGSNPSYWDTSGNPTTLQMYSGNTYVYPRGINNTGIMVGMAYELGGSGAYNNHAVVWMNTSSAPFALEGLSAGNYGSAEKINDNNVIFGYSQVNTDTSHAVLWSNTSANVWELTYDISAELESIGATVKGVSLEEDGLYGFYEDVSGIFHFVRWVEENFAWSREELYLFSDEFDSWTDMVFADINDNGIIVGTGTYEGETTVFALTQIPVPDSIPEPMTIVLLSSALIGVIRRIRY